jgi:hypothetical protein
MADDANAPVYAPVQGRPGDAILPPPVATTGGHTVRNILIGVGILLIGVLIGGYLVAAGAATAQRVNASHTALNTVDHHANGFQARMAAAMAGVDTSGGTSFDPVKARGVLDQASSQMDSIRSSDMADKVAVGAADARVQDRSILTAFSSGALDREHRRLGAYRRGLDAELAEITVLKQQLSILGDFLTTIEQLKPLNSDFTAANIAAGEKDYQAPSATLDKTIAEATANPDTPTKMKEFLGLFRSELTHIKGVLDAARDKSLTGFKASETLLQKDVDTLKQFDNSALQQQYTALGTRLDAQVNTLFKQAK